MGTHADLYDPHPQCGQQYWPCHRSKLLFMEIILRTFYFKVSGLLSPTWIGSGRAWWLSCCFTSRSLRGWGHSCCWWRLNCCWRGSIVINCEHALEPNSRATTVGTEVKAECHIKEGGLFEQGGTRQGFSEKGKTSFDKGCNCPKSGNIYGVTNCRKKTYLQYFLPDSDLSDAVILMKSPLLYLPRKLVRHVMKDSSEQTRCNSDPAGITKWWLHWALAG